MTNMITATREIAKLKGAKNCRQKGKNFPLLSSVVAVARSLWPSKTDMALADVTDADPRMCRYWLEEKYSLKAEHLAALLRSDDGLKFLEAIMGDAQPKWWKRFKRQSGLANLRAAIEQQRKQLERIELESADE